jgi:hypothetical protein
MVMFLIIETVSFHHVYFYVSQLDTNLHQGKLAPTALLVVHSDHRVARRGVPNCSTDY